MSNQKVLTANTVLIMLPDSNVFILENQATFLPIS